MNLGYSYFIPKRQYKAPTIDSFTQLYKIDFILIFKSKEIQLH